MEPLQENYRERTLPTTDGLMLCFREYGSRFGKATPVLCLPGLTRCARDFHDIAMRLAPNRRVLSLDARGRGESDYDPDYSNYNLVTEVGDVLTLVSSEFDRPCIVLGTSRGGLAAMILGGVRPSMLAGVILNDIGPVIERDGLLRIVDYLGIVPEPLEDWDDAVAALKASNSRDFPDLTDKQWLAWAKRTFREEDGKPALDYDVKLRDAVLEGPQANGDFWPQFRSLQNIPTLLLRGENSDLLSASTVEEMRRAKPDLTAVTVRNRGHVPFLDEPEAVTAISTFVSHVDARACAA